MITKTDDLTKGSIYRQLAGLAIPLIATNFIQTAYNIVDMIWIGRLGSDAVVSVGTAGFFINLGIAIFTLVVTGTGIKIAHSLGAKTPEKTKEYVINGYMMAIIIGLLFAGIMVLLRRPIIGFFNLQDAMIVRNAENYLAISMIGMPFMFFNALYAAILNSFGNSRQSFRMNAVGFVVNMILDPILIFGLGGIMAYGVVGAAYATVIARVSVFLLACFRHRTTLIKYRTKIGWHVSSAVEVIRLGYPTAIQRISFTIIGILMARIITSFGPTGIAVQKIGLQVESLSYMTIAGLYGAMSVFIGQNFGAESYDRIRQGYRAGFIFSFIFGAVTTLLFILLPEQIFGLFVKDEATIRMGVRYLQIIGLSQIFMCIEIVTMGSFNGLGKTHIPAVVSLSFSSLRLPLALFFGHYLGFGLNSIWWCITGTTMARGIVLVSLFVRHLKSMRHKMAIREVT